MVIINGPRQLIDTAVPAGLDALEMMRFQMMEGMTPSEVIAIASTVIGEANEHLMNSYGGLIVLTERDHARYASGGAVGMTPEGTEYAEEDGQVSQRVGHMLFYRKFKDATAWSRDYLEVAIREDIRDDLVIKKDRWVNRIDHDVFTAMFRANEVRVGTTGWAATWARGSGGNLNYIPPKWMTTEFDSTHSHFIRISAAPTVANVQSTLETMARELAHHGVLGMKVAYIGETIAGLFLSIENSKKFATFIPPEFRLLSGNSAAPISVVNSPGQIEGVPGEIIGYYSTSNGLVELRRHPRVPAGYMWMGKSYGNNNAQNPMSVRTLPGKGFGLTVNPQVTQDINPTIDRVEFRATHGVNVNNPLAGVAAQIEAGATAYVEPTIAS